MIFYDKVSQMPEFTVFIFCDISYIYFYLRLFNLISQNNVNAILLKSQSKYSKGFLYLILPAQNIKNAKENFNCDIYFKKNRTIF